MNETEHLASMTQEELVARRLTDWLEPVFDQNGERVDWLFRHWGPGGGTYKLQRKYKGQVLKDSHRTKDIVVAIEAHKTHPFAAKAVTSKPNDEIDCQDAFKIFLKEYGGNAESTRKAKSNWNCHCRSLYMLKFVEVVPQNIIAIKTEMEAKGLSPASVRGVQNTLGAFFSHFINAPHNWHMIHPVRAIGKQNRVPIAETQRLSPEVFVTEEEFDLWVAAALKPPRSAYRFAREIEYWTALQTSTLMEMSYEGGYRIGEISGLRFSKADLALDVAPYGKVQLDRQLSAALLAGKPETWHAPMKGAKAIGAKARDVPMTARAREVLDAYLAYGTKAGYLREGGPLWPTSEGTPRPKKDFQNRIADARDEAGIFFVKEFDLNGIEVERERAVSHHSLRHTYASNLYQQGWSIENIAQVLGNTPEVVRTRYTHVTENVDFNARVAAAGRAAKGTPAVTNVIQFPERRAA